LDGLAGSARLESDYTGVLNYYYSTTIPLKKKLLHHSKQGRPPDRQSKRRLIVASKGQLSHVVWSPGRWWRSRRMPTDSGCTQVTGHVDGLNVTRILSQCVVRPCTKMAKFVDQDKQTSVILNVAVYKTT